MAQGKLKQKVQLPKGVKKRGGNPNKQSGVKKGARPIAPKKARHIEATKLKKGLEKAIKGNIEHEMTMKASSMEVKGFNLLKKIGHSQASGSKEKGKK